uniref:Presenilin n=2 Tax=Haemonchus contortus TaxID=6289 RepID=A0A7I4XYA2_HAECO
MKMRQTCQCDGFTCRVISQFSEVSKLLRPVMLNMAMTLSAWIYVYEMKTDERLSAMFLMSGNSTTGNQYHDGIINAFSAMVVLAVVSFSMLLLALWDCRRLVQLWLHMSCLLILFAVSGGFFYDLLKSLEVDEDKIIYEYLPGLVTAYGGFGCIAFFYPGAPLLLHQFFVLSNCSLVSLFYLRSFPGYTAWFVLWCVALWDIFAVLAPIGPLRKVQEKAGDYSHDVLRFLMFTADAKPAPLNTRHPELEEESSSESESDEEEVADSGQQSTTGSSFTVTSDESEGEADAPPEQPLLRRRVRQAAGADTMEMLEDALSEEKKIKEELRKAERMKKEKNSDLSSDDDEIAVELEEELSAHTPDTTSDYLKNTPWEKEYPIDDKEALSMEHHRKNLESSSSDDDGSSSSDDDESYSSDEDSERSVEIEGASVTAADALNDANSLRLGMGDFVFYSVLVGQAATTGNIGATIAAALGVVYGLLITLTYFSNGDETTPALPISIVLGTIFHFSFLFLEPYALHYTEWMFHYLLG